MPIKGLLYENAKKEKEFVKLFNSIHFKTHRTFKFQSNWPSTYNFQPDSAVDLVCYSGHVGEFFFLFFGFDIQFSLLLLSRVRSNKLELMHCTVVLESL